MWTKRGRRHELFNPATIDALDPEQIATIVDTRQTWVHASRTPEAAAAELGIKVWELAAVAAGRDISAGRFGRYAAADIAVLAAEEDLAEQVRADRLVTADQAAELLDCCRRLSARGREAQVAGDQRPGTRIGGEGVVEHFQRDDSGHSRMPGRVYDPHAASTQDALDGEPGEHVPRRQNQYHSPLAIAATEGKPRVRGIHPPAPVGGAVDGPGATIPAGRCSVS